MTRYPRVLHPIHHNPRPVIDMPKESPKLHSTAQSSKHQMDDGKVTSTSAIVSLELSARPPESGRHTENTHRALVVAGPTPYPQFLLLGDSITQFGTLTLQARLQTDYIRRLDVVNRGFSGYTSIMGLSVLHRFLPPPPPSSSSQNSTNQLLDMTTPQIPLMTIFFGANDAVLPDFAQHVALPEYITTLTDMIHYPVFKSPSQPAPTRIILITPPPVNEHQLDENGRKQRKAGITSQYARAASRLGQTQGDLVKMLDLWSIFMTKVGWTPDMGRECCSEHLDHTLNPEQEEPDYQPSGKKAANEDEQRHLPGCIYLPRARIPGAEFGLEDFLVDGLHLTTRGYEVLYDEVTGLIEQTMPAYMPDGIPFVIDDWKDVLGVR